MINDEVELVTGEGELRPIFETVEVFKVRRCMGIVSATFGIIVGVGSC